MKFSFYLWIKHVWLFCRVRLMNVRTFVLADRNYIKAIKPWWTLGPVPAWHLIYVLYFILECNTNTTLVFLSLKCARRYDFIECKWHYIYKWTIQNMRLVDVKMKPVQSPITSKVFKLCANYLHTLLSHIQRHSHFKNKLWLVLNIINSDSSYFYIC